MITTGAYVKAAKSIYHREGEIEVDDTAEISESPDGDGAYVQAWVWVPIEELDSA